MAWLFRNPEFPADGSNSQLTPKMAKSCGSMCAPAMRRTCTLSPSYARSSGVYGSPGIMPAVSGFFGKWKPWVWFGQISEPTAGWLFMAGS